MSNKKEIIENIRLKIRNPDSVNPQLQNMISTIAELWEFAPNFARSLENDLVNYLNSRDSE